VKAAGLTNVVPGDGYYGDHEFWVPEASAFSRLGTSFCRIPHSRSRLFLNLQIPLVRGRFFSENERLEHDKYAIVNQEFIRQPFPAEDPLGKHLRVAWRTQQGENYEIIGVVGDTAYQIDRSARPMMWFPILAGIPGKFRRFRIGCALCKRRNGIRDSGPEDDCLSGSRPSGQEHTDDGADCGRIHRKLPVSLQRWY